MIRIFLKDFSEYISKWSPILSKHDSCSQQLFKLVLTLESTCKNFILGHLSLIIFIPLDFAWYASYALFGYNLANAFSHLWLYHSTRRPLSVLLITCFESRNLQRLNHSGIHKAAAAACLDRRKLITRLDVVRRNYWSGIKVQCALTTERADRPN